MTVSERKYLHKLFHKPLALKELLEFIYHCYAKGLYNIFGFFNSMILGRLRAKNYKLNDFKGVFGQ